MILQRALLLLQKAEGERLGKKEKKLEERTEKEKRKSLQIYRDELFQFPSLCFGLLCSFIGTTKPGMSE